jgi:hypothetical protein
MRPNTAALHYIVRMAKRDPVFVYSVKAGLLYSRARVQRRALTEDALTGVELPADLILVHEFRDHYSLQARREMTVSGIQDLYA